MTAPWAKHNQVSADKNGRRLAELCNCSSLSPSPGNSKLGANGGLSRKAIIECLQNLPANVIQTASEQVETNMLEFPFSPVDRDQHFFT